MVDETLFTYIGGRSREGREHSLFSLRQFFAAFINSVLIFPCAVSEQVDVPALFICEHELTDTASILAEADIPVIPFEIDEKAGWIAMPE